MLDLAIGTQRLSSLLPSARREVHRIVAKCTASAHARSYSSRLIHSSIVCGSFCPAPKVTVGTPWRTIQFASSPPFAARMFGTAPMPDTAAIARLTTGRLSFMRNGAENLDLPTICADRADGDIGGRAAVIVEGHDRRAKVGSLDVARAPQPALLAHAEQKRDRRMIELLLRELGRQRDENAAATAVVAAERGLRRIDDLAAGKLWLSPRAQRHRVHVGHEQDSRLVVHRAAAGQIDDEVAGLGRHGDPRICVVEADRTCRHTAFLPRRKDLPSN